MQPNVRTIRLLLSCATFLVACRVFACDTCVVESLKHGYKRASAVFVAEAISTSPEGARLRVIESFKGADSGVVVVSNYGAGCPYPGFVIGTRYFVFAERTAAGLAVSQCSHTNPITAPFVEREVVTTRARHRWWNSRLSGRSYAK